MQQNLNKIEEIIDKEIDTYKEIEQCVIDKKDIIIKGNVDELKDIDTKLIEHASCVAGLARARQEESIVLGKINMSFEEIIQKAYDYDKKQSERLKEKKTFLKSIVEKVQKMNNLNAILIKHSLVIMEKTMGMIVNTAIPEADSYNKNGKMNKLNENYKMSSISTEA